MKNKNDILAAELREFIRESKKQTSTRDLKIDNADCESLSKRIAQNLLSDLVANGFLSHISNNPAFKPKIESRNPAWKCYASLSNDHM